MVLLLLLLPLPRIIKLELRINLCIRAGVPKFEIRLPIRLVESSTASPLLEEKLYAKKERGMSSLYVCVWPRAAGRVVHAGRRRR